MKQKKIDWTQIDAYLRAQCTGKEIAEIFGVSYETLCRRCKQENGVEFGEYAQIKKTQGVNLIRAKQYEIAMKGDKTMLIWLGKQYLGQKETVDLDNVNTQSVMNVIVDSEETKKIFNDLIEFTKDKKFFNNVINTRLKEYKEKKKNDAVAAEDN